MFAIPEKLYWLEMSDAYWDERIPDSAGTGLSDAQWKERKEKNKAGAYEGLKSATGQDFGYDLAAWEQWLIKNTPGFKF